MARSTRYENNLKRIQNVLDDKHESKIQSGYTPDNIEHKVGDRWTDSDGVEWEQKNGYRSKVSKIIRGLGDNCKKCEKLIIKSFDKDTYSRMGKCYHCQMNFELDLKYSRIGNSGNKWVFWVRLQQLNNMNAIEKAMGEYIDEMHKAKNLEDKPFDMSVANALANSNIDSTTITNKKLTS